MWNNVITGLFAIAGLVIGVLLEPLKGLFVARARNRQQRAEQAALVVTAATEAKHSAVELNAAFRHRMAGNRMNDEQELELVRTYNRVRDDLRKAVGLLRLHGPDKLAEAGDSLREADEALFRLVQEPDQGAHDLAKLPPKVLAAASAVDEQVTTFAKLARKHIT